LRSAKNSKPVSFNGDGLFYMGVGHKRGRFGVP
jgi:hypothetical protein